ncbi:MAG: bacillithiol system redox-active protein YtxJ [Flavobacteriales bacterium]|nr:bacillithiol system redox-active protein YtxJ [Flavobacteriales bacterium]
MEWTPLTAVAELDAIDRLSAERPVLVFKHSTQCSISAGALDRLEAGAIGHPAYFLDLLAHRAVSDAVEARYGVRHESPQVLVVRAGKCVYHASHRAITFGDTLAAMQAAV